jgi:hypothetical protein
MIKNYSIQYSLHRRFENFQIFSLKFYSLRAFQQNQKHTQFYLFIDLNEFLMKKIVQHIQ